MNLLNYDILHAICEYCDQAHLKKFVTLSKKHNQVAKYSLIYTFEESELLCIKKYHHKIHLKTNLIPVTFHQQIVILNLSYSKLTTLPDSIGQLSQLRELYVAGNQLTTLPDSIGQLTQLRELYVGYNQLTTLPDSIGQLAQLQVLYVEHNQLTTLPDSIGQLAQLQVLCIYNNELTSLPDSIEQLSQLQTLN